MNSLLRQPFLTKTIIKSSLPILARARYIHSQPQPKPTPIPSIASLSTFKNQYKHKQSGHNNHNNQCFNKSHILYGGAFAAALAGVYEKTNEWRFGKEPQDSKFNKKSQPKQVQSPLIYDPNNTKWIYLFKEGTNPFVMNHILF